MAPGDFDRLIPGYRLTRTALSGDCSLPPRNYVPYPGFGRQLLMITLPFLHRTLDIGTKHLELD